MKPETTVEETVTADELAKQVALDKVSWWVLLDGDGDGLWICWQFWDIELTFGALLDFFCVSVLPLTCQRAILPSSCSRQKPRDIQN